MRNFFRLLAVFATVLLFVSTVEAAKKTVALMPLENVSGYTEQRVAEIMTEQLAAVINGSGNYIVVERVQMGTVLKEQGLQSLTGDADKTSQMVGADYSVVGKVIMAEIADTAANSLSKKIFGKNRNSVLMDPYRGRVSLNFRFVNNSTGEIIFDQTVEGSDTAKTKEGAIHDACKDAAKRALKEIQLHNPFSAQVAKVSGDMIYIDAGLDGGLKIGETLLIVREDEPIESNGKVIGMTLKTVGRAKITDINAEYSICKVISHAGNVRKGDIVKREK